MTFKKDDRVKHKVVPGRIWLGTVIHQEGTDVFVRWDDGLVVYERAIDLVLDPEAQVKP